MWIMGPLERITEKWVREGLITEEERARLLERERARRRFAEVPLALAYVLGVLAVSFLVLPFAHRSSLSCLGVSLVFLAATLVLLRAVFGRVKGLVAREVLSLASGVTFAVSLKFLQEALAVYSPYVNWESLTAVFGFAAGYIVPSYALRAFGALMATVFFASSGAPGVPAFGLLFFFLLYFWALRKKSWVDVLVFSFFSSFVSMPLLNSPDGFPFSAFLFLGAVPLLVREWEKPFRVASLWYTTALFAGVVIAFSEAVWSVSSEIARNAAYYAFLLPLAVSLFSLVFAERGTRSVPVPAALGALGALLFLPGPEGGWWRFAGVFLLYAALQVHLLSESAFEGGWDFYFFASVFALHLLFLEIVLLGASLPLTAGLLISLLFVGVVIVALVVVKEVKRVAREE